MGECHHLFLHSHCELRQTEPVLLSNSPPPASWRGRRGGGEGEEGGEEGEYGKIFNSDLRCYFTIFLVS